MPKPLDDALLPNDAAGLEAELAEIEIRQKECLAEIKRLMASENPSAGVFFAGEIHAVKQTHMMLRYQKELRNARLKRLRMGFE